MTKFFQSIISGILVLGCLSASVTVNAVRPVTALGCDDVQFIFARGSGEGLRAKSEIAWRAAMQEKLQNTKLRYSFYELGTSAHGGARYPAVTVSGASGFGNLLGAFFSAGLAFDFGRSVTAGVTELKAYISEVSRACPTTRFVLGGYSQGAMLLTRALPEINSEKIIYTATFGDPKLYLPEGEGKFPAACVGENLSNYRAYVPDCHAHEGILGGYHPYQTTVYRNKLGAWCNDKDIMCSSGMMFEDHGEYISRGLYQNAADTIVQKLYYAFPGKLDAPSLEITAPQDLVILLNISSAVMGILEQYRAEAYQLAHEVYAQGGRVALYTYSDTKKFRTQLRCDFSCTPREFDAALAKGTRYYSTGESVDATLSTLYTAMKTLKWRVGATKSAVVISPRAYDRVDRDGTMLKDVIALSLKIDPVNVYAITSNEATRRAYAPLVEGTNGQAFILSSNMNAAHAAITARPAPALALENYSGQVGQTITFDASGSGRAQSLRYDWDLDGDNVFELQDAGAVVQKAYATPISGHIQVRVTDGQAYSSTMSAQLEIYATAPEQAEIYELVAEQQTATSYKISFATNATRLLVALGDAVLGSIDSVHQKQFTVSDITAPIELRLIPYSEATGRGEAATIQLGQTITDPAPANPMPVEPAPTTPVNPATPIDQANSTNHTPDGSTLSAAPIFAVIPGQPSWPTAPNSGVSLTDDAS